MLPDQAARFDSPERLQVELDDLRRNLLPLFLAPLLTVPLLWLVYVTLRDWHMGWVDLAVLETMIAMYASYRLREGRFALACWVIIIGLALAQGLVLLEHQESLAMAFGGLVIIAAYALLGPLQAVAAGGVMWVAVAVGWHYGTGSWTLWSMLATAALYGLTWGATWVAGRSLHTSVLWALGGWEHAREMLAETQERRGELYRAVRALEEATFRIERVNSELLVARHEAEEARAHKAWFVATVSHELRGPLNLILGYSRLMAMSPEKYGELLSAGYRADVATIYRNSQHLADLIDDILDLSQIEAQRLPLIKERVDLEQDVIRQAVNIIAPLAERKGLFVRMELQGGFPPILADPVRLRQVLINLLTNAVRFTVRGGITVRTSQQGEKLAVSVQDSGAGIPTEELPRLFVAFHQAHAERNKRQGGTGLGLAISKQLIEQHGGEIWVESVQGVGTTFQFTVPLPGADLTPAPTVRTEDRLAMMDRPRWLVVHSDPMMVRLLARHLTGFRVVGVTDDREVPTITRELHPWAIITSSPTIETIHAQVNQQVDVPIIGFSLPDMREQAFEGVLSYLVKPITPEMIRLVLRQVAADDGTDGTTVLLVDDDPDAVRLLESILTSLPHTRRILRAYDGLQALEVMRETPPDVVFLDMVMPGLDGEQTILQMRADERLRSIPVVLISAQDSLDASVAIGTPIRTYTQRPLEASKGIRCLQALLEVLHADYLSDSSAAPAFPIAGPDQSVSATPPLPLGPEPGAAA